MFERFTDGGRRIIVHAQQESMQLRHDRIGTEHLLLGLCHDATTAAALEAAGLGLAAAREQVRHERGARWRRPRGHIPFTANARRVLEGAAGEADRLGQAAIGPAHLLAALLAGPDGHGLGALRALGVDHTALAERVRMLAAAGDPAPVRDPATPSRARPLQGGSGGPVALADALRRYGRHDEGCPEGRGCTCGLQELLDRLA